MGLIGLSFFVMMTLFHLWDLPGDVLAAPESASGLDRCNLSLSLPWQIPEDETVCINTKQDKPMSP